jgi:SMI1-KNR4 cell-wall
MKTDPTTDIAQRLRELSDLDDSAIEGAAATEIGELETYAGGSLPDTYRRFLSVMGRSAGALLRGSDCLLTQRHGLRLRESAERIIHRSGAGFELPQDAFVFLVHHGYQFLYFHLQQGDDPPVFRFSDADQTANQIADSFSSFLLARLSEHEELSARRTAALESRA